MLGEPLSSCWVCRWQAVRAPPAHLPTPLVRFPSGHWPWPPPPRGHLVGAGLCAPRRTHGTHLGREWLVAGPPKIVR